jgi:hypothetical protein
MKPPTAIDWKSLTSLDHRFIFHDDQAVDVYDETYDMIGKLLYVVDPEPFLNNLSHDPYMNSLVGPWFRNILDTMPVPSSFSSYDQTIIRDDSSDFNYNLPYVFFLPLSTAVDHTNSM